MFQVNPLLGMKNQALLSSKDKSKKLKCRLLQFLFGALRVKFCFHNYSFSQSQMADPVDFQITNLD